uniref:Uncharacterized protein LOC114342783 n=1 Tax=Diabrotica virgifera virgifera TaxID=50390 RepID=A0A6P7GTL5_DIAVI
MNMENQSQWKWMKPCFPQEVPSRAGLWEQTVGFWYDRKEQWKIVSRTILPGTLIVTDGWGSYRNIGHLDGGVYEHRTVIHQNNFVDPVDDSVHTQTIESVWMRSKKKLCRQCGTSMDWFPSYLQEFIWRERIKEPFVEFLLCILEQCLV